MSEVVNKYIQEVALPMKAIFKDMLKYAPSKIFGLLGNIAVVPVYTNLLSPSQYGVYVISLAVLSFLCIIFSDWIGLAGLRFFRQNQLEGILPKYVSTLAIILGSNLCVMFVVALLLRNSFYHYFNISPKIFLFVLILIVPVAMRALLFQILRAQIKPGSFTVTTIINQILTIVIAVMFFKYTSLGAVSILAAMAISITLIDIILVFQTDILWLLRFEKPDFNMIKILFIYGIPIAVASLSLWIINQSNKFITSHFYGLVDAGLVGVAYNLTFPILMTLFAIITIAAYPRLINLYEDKTDVRPLISKLTGYYMLISLPVVVIMSVYAKDLIVLFANSKYYDAFVLLPYLAFSAFFLSFTDYTTYQYHLSGKTYVLTTLKVVSAIIGLVLNIYLIQKMGLVGVGVATLAANILYFVLTNIVVIPGLNWQIPFKRIFHLLLCFVPSAALWYILQISPITPVVQIYILLSFYYLLFYFTKGIFKDELG